MMMSRQVFSNVEANGIIVLYDLLAFGTQPLTGRWVDHGGTRPYGLTLAIVLLLGGALISSLPASASIVIAVAGASLLGMGNSFFHVYGGRFVAVASRHDIRAMGVFVSTGAVGLAVGIGFNSQMLLAVFVLALLILSALHLHMADRQKAAAGLPTCAEAEQASHPSQPFVLFLYLSCLMLVVSGRACIGESVPSLRHSIPSMSPPVTMVMVSILVMVGKAAGGFLSKWWGVRNVFIVSLLLSGLFFLMCPWHNGFVVITLLLINLSMPCTLYLATKALPGREGWAFGLLAMALLPGFLIGNLFKDDATYQALLTPLMATIILESLLLLYMREGRWQVLAVSVVLNILTNVPLNAFVMAYRVTYPLYLIGLECVVVIIEFIGYWLVLHDRNKAFRYSLLCNMFSALTGCLFQILFLDYLVW